MKLSDKIKELLSRDGSGTLDQIVRLRHLEAEPCNASVFSAGDVVQIWEPSVNGQTPIKRGEATIAKVYPKARRIIFEGPLPEGTQRGDFLIVQN